MRSIRLREVWCAVKPDYILYAKRLRVCSAWKWMHVLCRCHNYMAGKIYAALSRQHPRDLFDVRHMDVPLSAVKDGIIFCLLGSDRPIHESFSPNFIDQREAMENQFVGMSDIPFSYEEFEMTRNNLIKGVSDIMTEADKRFLVGFEELTVNREESPYSMFFDFPSVKWKIQNLQKLKTTNPRKLQAEANKLRLILGID